MYKYGTNTDSPEVLKTREDDTWQRSLTPLPFYFLHRVAVCWNEIMPTFFTHIAGIFALVPNSNMYM